ncbi:hypothetical protein [Nocardiopsis sp. CNT-189]
MMMECAIYRADGRSAIEGGIGGTLDEALLAVDPLGALRRR